MKSLWLEGGNFDVSPKCIVTSEIPPGIPYFYILYCRFNSSDTLLLPTGSEERGVLGAVSILVPILSSYQYMKNIALGTGH